VACLALYFAASRWRCWLVSYGWAYTVALYPFLLAFKTLVGYERQQTEQNKLVWYDAGIQDFLIAAVFFGRYARFSPNTLLPFCVELSASEAILILPASSEMVKTALRKKATAAKKNQ